MFSCSAYAVERVGYLVDFFKFLTINRFFTSCIRPGTFRTPTWKRGRTQLTNFVRFMLKFFSQSDIAYIDITLAVEFYSSSKVSSRELRCALLIAIVMTNVESMCD